MPNYDWACVSPECGTVFEQFLTLEEHDKLGGVVQCKCGASAEQVILPRRRRSRGAYLPEITYFESPDGHVILAGNEHDTAPNGYIKKTTGLLNEQRKLSSRLNSQDRALFSEMMAGEQAYLSQQISEEHREMRGIMESYDDIYKDLARLAMEQNNQKSAIWDRSGQNRDFGYLKILE